MATFEVDSTLPLNMISLRITEPIHKSLNVMIVMIKRLR